MYGMCVRACVRVRMLCVCGVYVRVRVCMRVPMLRVCACRLLFLSSSIREKNTLSITPSTRAFHRYKGKNLASFFIDQVQQ